MKSYCFSCRIFVVAFLAGMTMFSANAGAATIDFEDLALDPQSQWHGPDPYGESVHQSSPYEDDLRVGKFTSGGTNFNNIYSEWYGSWAGWAYSNKTYNPSNYMPGDYNPGSNPNPVPTGWTSQYYAVPGGDAGGPTSSANYAMAYVGWGSSIPKITFSSPTPLQGVFFTNNNYAYYSMLEGDPPGGFAKIFTAQDQDYLKLTITGKDVDGGESGSVIFYLADFRDAQSRIDNPRKDNYILDQWMWVDLSGLGNNVKSLEFRLTSSDSGPYGINTPTYFAMDNLATGAKPLWTGAGNNNWSNAVNWSSGATPGSGQNIIFNNNTHTTIDLDGNQNIANITFDSALAGAFTLNNNMLTLDAGGSISVTGAVTTSQTFNCNLALAGDLFLINDSMASGQSLKITGNIKSTAPGGVQNLVLGGEGHGLITGTIDDGITSGALGLIKQGDGVWTLKNNLDCSGETNIQDGLLQLNGLTSNLRVINGEGDLGVGDGVNPATLFADSIAVNTLTVSAGSTIVIRPNLSGPLSGGDDLRAVPEPDNFALTAIAALVLFIWRVRQTVAA